MDTEKSTLINQMKKAFLAAPPQVQSLIESDKITPFLSSAQQEFQFGQEAYAQLSNELLLLVLGLSDPEELLETILDIEDFPPESALPFIERLQHDLLSKLKTSQVPDQQEVPTPVTTSLETSPSKLLEEGDARTKDVSASVPKEKPIQPSRPQGIDPYREPIE